MESILPLVRRLDSRSRLVDRMSCQHVVGRTYQNHKFCSKCGLRADYWTLALTCPTCPGNGRVLWIPLAQAFHCQKCDSLYAQDGTMFVRIPATCAHSRISLGRCRQCGDDVAADPIHWEGPSRDEEGWDGGVLALLMGPDD
jgi:hypothetical protein